MNKPFKNFMSFVDDQVAIIIDVIIIRLLVLRSLIYCR